jgi:hypothetical protein
LLYHRTMFAFDCRRRPRGSKLSGTCHAFPILLRVLRQFPGTRGHTASGFCGNLLQTCSRNPQLISHFPIRLFSMPVRPRTVTPAENECLFCLPNLSRVAARCRFFHSLCFTSDLNSPDMGTRKSNVFSPDCRGSG